MCAQCNRISYIYIYILLHPKEVTCQSCLFSQLLFLVSAAAAAAAHSIALLAILLSAHPPVLVLRKGGGKAEADGVAVGVGVSETTFIYGLSLAAGQKKKQRVTVIRAVEMGTGSGEWSGSPWEKVQRPSSEAKILTVAT